MIEKTEKRKKGTLSEEDIGTLLQRYTATTILALFQEVAHYPDVKIDWNALAKKTSTGISNPREYQMIWRHLAYRDPLFDKLEDGAVPLDNDSDLEYELEAVPSISTETSNEASACVKVLIASGAPSDAGIPSGSTVEAPLTINIPNGQLARVPSDNSQLPWVMQGTNITVPVSVQKQPLPSVTPSEAMDANGPTGSNMPSRRKRKPWSEEEDMELIAAVQKCGEGNWANILRGDFKGDRTASQLSQRWSIIRKKKGNLNVGGPNPTGPHLSELQLATHAMSVALGDMPTKTLLGGASLGMAASAAAQPSAAAATSNTAVQPSTAAATPNTAPKPTCSTVVQPCTTNGVVQAQHQSGPGPVSPKLAPKGSPGATEKLQASIKKFPMKSNFTSDFVTATAVAAGARIATPSDAAASHLKAAQAKNTVHLMGVSTTKSFSSCNATHLDTKPNVHYMSTGLATTANSSYSAAGPGASRPGTVKAASSKLHHASFSRAKWSNVPSEQTDTSRRSLEVKTLNGTEVSEAKNPSKEDRICASEKIKSEEKEGKKDSPHGEAEPQIHGKIPCGSVKVETTSSYSLAINDNRTEDGQKTSDTKIVDGQKTSDTKIVGVPKRESGDNKSAGEEWRESGSTNKKGADSASLPLDNCENGEVLKRAESDGINGV